jgi:hypothetical protein
MEENVQPSQVDESIRTNLAVEVPTSTAKSFLPYLLVVVIGAILAVTFYFYNQTQVLKNKLMDVASPPASPSPAFVVASADPTSTWQIYTNNELKFSIKMPQDSQLNESNGKYYFVGGPGMFVLGINNKLEYKDLAACPPPYNRIMKIPCVFSTFDGSKEIREEYIDGHKAVSFRYWYSAGEYHSVYQTTESPFIQLEFNGQIFREEIGSEGTKERDQILSTFKFLDSQTSEPKKATGYIKSFNSVGSMSLVIDEVEYLNDNTAPNGFKINNPSINLDTIMVSPQVIIKMNTYSRVPSGDFNWNQKLETTEFASIFLDDLVQSKSLYDLVIENGKVTNITERYIP